MIPTTHIRNYTIQEFLTKPKELVEQYMFYLEESNPQNFIHTDATIMSKGRLIDVRKKRVCKTLWFRPWGVVEELKTLVSDQENNSFDKMMKILELVFDISPREALTTRIADYYGCMKWIAQGIDNIMQAESINLNYEPSNPKEKAAFEMYQKDFEKLDMIPTIDSLAGGDISKWEQVKKLPYGYVHRKLWLNTLQRKVQDQLTPKTSGN